MAEFATERWAVAEAEKVGWFVRKLAFVNVRGGQDRLFIRNGEVLFVEFKARGKEARLLQSALHAEMSAHGARCHVVSTRREAAELFGIPFTFNPLRPHL